MSDWNPELYNRFRRYRAEPFFEIIGRLELGEEESIADLGCGSGENTVELARRTARGTAHGIDSSRAMIDAAEKLREGLPAELKRRVSFELRDIGEFGGAERKYSVIFSNAALQWVPGHREIFRACFEALTSRGRIVAQMPANENETAKLELSRLAREQPWAAMLGGVEEGFREVPPPEYYQDLLRSLGFTAVDCYYRTFDHPMNNPGEIVQFYSSTGLRPFLDALPAERRPEFVAELTRRFERAYGTAGAVVFPFRRLFIWGVRPAL
jgi:trans-aconitate 2-methyltransferase